MYTITNKYKRGFTLIELLVVITIIGVLSSLLVVNYVGVRSRSRDATRKSDLHQIQSALELYRNDSGSYPLSLPACGTPLDFNGITYMRQFPCDPTNSEPLKYKYQTAFNDSAYTLAACLENVNDSQKDASNNPQTVASLPSITACINDTTYWSYTLFSP